MNRILRILAVCLSVAGCTGCAGLLDPGPPIAQVILPVRMPVTAQAERLPAQLLVIRPVADAAAGSDRIMALMHGYELRALSSARWASPVPALVQRLLVDSLESTRRLEAVGWEDSGMDAAFRLTTDVRSFYLRYEAPEKPPAAEVALVLGLTETGSGKFLGYKRITVERPCAGNSVPEFVAAFSLAMGEALEQSSEWVIGSIAEKLNTERRK